MKKLKNTFLKTKIMGKTIYETDSINATTSESKRLREIHFLTYNLESALRVGSVVEIRKIMKKIRKLSS